ncbi:MAG: DUF3221 domain-containing protein [Lachnospiraceae bacterium]|nr:DUF3221 domain-containing protein [Lachnospiraceae bacterium]
MKKINSYIIMIIMLCLMTAGCTKEKTETFTGTIIEKGDSYVVVEPCAEEEIRKSADQISFGTEQLDKMFYVGDIVKVTYTGDIMESYPAQINAIAWELIGSDENYTAEDEKPVIYLYPEEEIKASVKLKLDGELTCTYPSYNEGWNVTASPDGTLTDANGQIYNYLYWEGRTDAEYDFTKGFCVKGEDTASFLEEALEKLGLTRKEANEFIVYWLPLMQDNPYNIISFQTDVYTESAKLDITPQPDTLIRVFMAWKISDSYVTIEEQKLDAPHRKGFTVVEWGGAKSVK